MKRELIRRILYGLFGGIVIGYVITISISVIAGDGNYYPCVPGLEDRFGSEIMAVVIQAVSCGVLGAGFAGASLIWEKDEWSLLKQTAVYFAITTALMMTTAYVCEWMEHSVKGVLGYFAVFFGIFIAVWAVQYSVWKRRIKEINARIESKG